jgi:periplasmic copper chaperone A
MQWRAAAVFALCVAACTRDSAEESPAATPSRVAAHRAWARAADSGGLTAAYLVISNTGELADTLKVIGSPAAEGASMHVSMGRGGTVQMVPVRSLPVRPRDSVVFQPFGTHVMLTGLRQSYSDGDTIPVTLEFSSGTSLAVPVIVRRP